MSETEAKKIVIEIDHRMADTLSRTLHNAHAIALAKNIPVPPWADEAQQSLEAARVSVLSWGAHGSHSEAWIGSRDDGVRFTIEHRPTCRRRGEWRLLVEVIGGSHRWGCFDEQDQPTRYYFSEAVARLEADRIAAALFKEHDRAVGPVGSGGMGS